MQNAADKTQVILRTLEEAGQRILAGDASISVPCERRYRQCLPETTFHLYHELFIQIGGHNCFTFPDSQLDMVPGDIMLLPAELSHGEQARDGREPFLHLVAMFQAKSLAIHLGRLGVGGTPVPGFTLNYEVLRHPTLQQITGDTINCLLQDTSDDILRNGLQLTLLGYLIDQVRHGRPQQATGHLKVQQAKRLVAARLAHAELSVSNLAGIIGCNPDYLSNLFHRETGETLSAYITRKRLETAREYLLSTTMNVSEIAWACGYNDPSYFTHKFRQAHGCPPSAYRSRQAPTL
jgi:AraC-like DNA-binding protein